MGSVILQFGYCNVANRTEGLPWEGQVSRNYPLHVMEQKIETRIVMECHGDGVRALHSCISSLTIFPSPQNPHPHRRSGD